MKPFFSTTIIDRIIDESYKNIFFTVFTIIFFHEIIVLSYISNFFFVFLSVRIFVYLTVWLSIYLMFVVYLSLFVHRFVSNGQFVKWIHLYATTSAASLKILVPFIISWLVLRTQINIVFRVRRLPKKEPMGVNTGQGLSIWFWL